MSKNEWPRPTAKDRQYWREKATGCGVLYGKDGQMMNYEGSYMHLLDDADRCEQLERVASELADALQLVRSEISEGVNAETGYEEIKSGIDPFVSVDADKALAKYRALTGGTE